MRVLVVSDAPDACATVCDWLGEPVEADRAVDGGVAIDMVERALARGTPFDMVGVALGLRDMDGFFVLKRIRDAERRAGVPTPTPAWLLTSTEAGRGIVNGQNSAFDAHLHLPDGQLERNLSKYDAISSGVQSTHCA